MEAQGGAFSFEMRVLLPSFALSSLGGLVGLLSFAAVARHGDGPDGAPASPRTESMRFGDRMAAGASSAPSLEFPLGEPADFEDTFGDPRGRGRSHEGVDIAVPKRTPVRAAAAGTITWMHDERGGRCCALELLHDDGWRSRYIHLDNDTPGTDDGRGWGFAAGLAEGARVEAGDLIGWSGDSGNAEDVGPHLHFELRDPEGRPVNAYAALLAARDRRGGSAPAGAPLEIASR